MWIFLSSQVDSTNRAGYLNALWLLERKDKAVENKMVIRFYGGNSSSPWKKEELFNHGFGRHLETVVACAASATRIGPKVYTASETFRIEEYIESRNLSWDDYNDDAMMSEFARNLARFHSLIQRDEFAPYRVKKNDLFAHAEGLLVRFKDMWPRVVDRAREQYHYTGNVNDLSDQLETMKRISTKIQLKDTLINWDLNRMNILIRNETQHEDQLKTVLIDYEFAHFDMRAFDIGITASRCVIGSAVSSDKLVYTDDEIFTGLQRFEDVFIKSYHAEYVKYCNSVDVHGVDSWHNVKIESYFGACFAWIFSYSLMMLFMIPLTRDEDKVIDILAQKLSASFHFHRCAKSKLLQLCPHLSDV